MSDALSGGNTAGSTSVGTGAASPAAQPTADATYAGSAEQSTQQTGTTDSTQGERSPFIPRERFDEVNTKLRQLQEWRDQYAWAESVPREQLEQMAQWYGRYQGDPGEFLEYAYNEALNHPVHGAAVKSRIGRMLASLRAQPQQPERIEPGIPVLNEQGQIVGHTYNDAQIEQLLEQKLDAALNPFKEDLEIRRGEQQREAVRQQSYAIADQHVEYVKQLPMFEEYKADIKEVFAANRGISLLDAYNHVLKTKIFPTFGQKAEARVLSDLQQKANAQTVTSGSPSGTARPQFKSFEEAATYYAQHPDEAAAMANR